jgi:succinoglycan biosynthesis protein ExoM
MNAQQTSIIVGACTFRRPDGLRALLTSLAALHCPDDVDLEIVIVDNDETPSAQTLLRSIGPTLPFACRYEHEPRPGISQARNRMLTESQNADFLLFVDDDETVDPDLVAQHLRIQRKTKATFVQGPCVMTVKDPSDEWWLQTAFFKQKTFPDGASRHESWSNNVLIDMGFVTEHNLRFDEMLGYAGGEDTVFFQDIIRAGGTGAFAAKAVVREVQLESRLTWDWALKRQYRYGVTRANTQLLRRPKLKAMAWCLPRAVVMITLGALIGLSVVFKGKRGLANGAALIARGGGLVMGAIGFRADEYARPT